jgi:LysR family hydrogen peroxide-inducible transcriptional activator
MTLTQLSYIIAVDTYRHFATAAEKSFVTQPTLSMQIQKLEDELGVVIFDRSKQPVIPTEIGARIIEQARIIVKESQVIKHIISDNRDTIEGEYRIGIIPTLSSYLIPRFLKEFTDTYPNVTLIFQELMTNEIIGKLHEDQIDVGIIATPPPNHHFKELPLFFEPFTAYVSPEHHIYDEEYIQSSDLERDEIWLLSEGHCLRDQTLDLCKATSKQKKNQVHFESGSLETLIKLVDQHYGFTILPYLATIDLSEEKQKYVRPFKESNPGRNVRLLYGRMYSKNKILNVLREVIMSNLPEGVTPAEY